MDQPRSAIDHLRLVVGRQSIEPPEVPIDISHIPYPDIVGRLKTPWAKAACATIYERRRNRSGMRTPTGVQAQLECLCRVEEMLLSKKMVPSELDWAELIARERGPRLRVVIAELEQHIPRVMPSPVAWREAIYRRYLLNTLDKLAQTWKEPLVRAYSEHLDRRQQRYRDRGWFGEHERLRAETKKGHVKTVVIFLKFVEERFGIASTETLMTRHVDAFSNSFRVPLHGIRDFVAMLKRRGKIAQAVQVIEEIPESPDVRHLLLPSEVADLTQQLLSLAETDLTQEALAALFVLHYAQSAKSAAGLKIENIGWNADESLTVRFGTVDLTIHPVISAVMKCWLEKRTELLQRRGDTDNPYLFVDRKLSLPLDPRDLLARLGFKGHNLQTWRASAILNAFRSGVRGARVVVDAFGVSMPTAIRYQRIFGTTIRSQVTLKK